MLSARLAASLPEGGRKLGVRMKGVCFDGTSACGRSLSCWCELWTTLRSLRGLSMDPSCQLTLHIKIRPIYLTGASCAAVLRKLRHDLGNSSKECPSLSHHSAPSDDYSFDRPRVNGSAACCYCCCYCPGHSALQNHPRDLRRAT